MTPQRQTDDIRSDLENGIPLPENERTFQEIWNASTSFVYPKVDTDVAWNELKQKIETQTAPKKNVIWIGVAASLIIVAAFTWILYFNSTTAPLETHFSSQIGEHTEIMLSDGSSVILNGNSKLKVHADFGKKSRAISLSGDAYFKVAPNKKQAFIVHLDQLQIEVTGTEFRAGFNNNQNIQVTLFEGSVNLLLKNTVTPLKPGQTAQIKLEPATISLINSTPSMQDTNLEFLHFHNETLQDIAKSYNYYTGITFMYPENLAGVKLSTSLPFFDSELAVKILSETLNTTIKVHPTIEKQ